jgi:oligopeptide/dipeptide ABC transporter ATP-binding protein
MNPIVTVEGHVAAPLRAHGFAQNMIRNRVLELLSMVRLPSPQSLLNRYPHQLSGGMRQRVVTATALAAGPRLLLADEPTTALDPTIQRQILKLLRDLQSGLGLAMVFVTHDFGIVRDICDDVAVMYAGRIVEKGSVHAVLDSPQHPYTQGLLRSLPSLRSAGDVLYTIPGRPPVASDRFDGCRFSARCSSAMDRCWGNYPDQFEPSPGHDVACWLAAHDS